MLKHRLKNIFVIILIFALATTLQAGVEEDYVFAKRMYDDTLYEEAISKFNNIIAAYPTSEEAEKSELYIGNCYFQLQNYAKAIEAYKHLIEAYPDTKYMLDVKFHLAESQFRYELYLQAAKNYEWLMNNYPESRFTLQSLKNVVLCYKYAGKYNEAILVTERILKNYADQPQIPEIILLLAEIYDLNNMDKEYRMSLEKIIADYSNSDTRWKAAEMLADTYLELKNYDKALQVIEQNLKKITPRHLEQDLVRKKAKIFFESNKFDSALTVYNKYIRKFDDAKDLDKMNAQVIRINYKQGEYERAIENCYEFIQNFPYSELIPEIYLYKAKAARKIGKYSLALKALNDKNFVNSSKNLRYQAQYQKVFVFDSQKKYDQSIPIYLDLIQNYPDFVASDSAYFQVARIYHLNKNDYKKAIEYYQIILNTFPKSELKIEANLSLAECYEKIGEFKNSYQILESLQSRIDLSAKNRELVNEKINYLKDFKIKDSDEALTSFMKSFADFLYTRDEYRAIKDVLKIYNEDLKNFSQTIKIAERFKKFNNKPEFLLLKAKAYYQLAQRYEYENNIEASDAFKSAKNIFNKIIDDFPNSPQFAYAEYYSIEIEKRQYEDKSSEYYGFLQRAYKKFIDQHSTFSLIGKIYLKLASVMIDQDDFDKQEDDKIIIYLQQAATLTNDKNVKNTAYAKLGSIYTDNEKYNLALKQFNKIDKEFLKNRGDILFRVGLVEYELDNYENALNYLKVFTNSFPDDKNYYTGLKFIGNILKKQNNYEDAIYYFQKVTATEKANQDEVLRELVQLYHKTGQFKKAIETSANIKDVTNDDRRALTQILLADGATAEALLVMEKCIESENNLNKQLQDILFVANIHFRNRNYENALENYQDILLFSQEYDNRMSEFADLAWKKIIQNLIVSSYESGSRSKAEDYEKQFDDIIDENTQLDANLLLARGKYYAPLDRDKAEDIFDDVIDDFAQTKAAEKAYFQKSIIKIKQQDLTEAKEILNEFIKKFPDSELINNVRLKLGSINFSNSNYKEALDNYKYVIDNDKEGKLATQAIENFALTCKAMGEWLVAIEAYQLLQERVDSPRIKPKTLFEIAYCYYMDKKYDKAIGMFNKVENQVSDRELLAEIYFWIGDSYFQKQEYEKAIEELLKIVYNYNDYPQWYVNANIKIATAYEKQEKFDKARMFYRNVINRFGTENRWGKEAKKLMDSLP